MGPNVDLLRKLARKLRRMRHEEHYNQGLWITKTSCGTAACIAGWAVLETGWKPVSEVACRRGDWIGDIPKEAARELGLDVETELFSPVPGAGWPEEFAERWRKAMRTASERPSRIAADLLDALADGRVEPF